MNPGGISPDSRKAESERVAQNRCWMLSIILDTIVDDMLTGCEKRLMRKVK